MNGHFQDGDRAGDGLDLERDFRHFRIAVWVAIVFAAVVCAMVLCAVTR